MPGRPLRIVACALAVLAVASCSGDSPQLAKAAGRPTTTATTASTTTTGTSAPTIGTPSTGTTTTAPLLNSPSTIATVRTGLDAVKVYPGPDAATTIATVENPGEYGQPQVFLVLDQEPGWTRVLLPVRPNGTTGWVRDVDITTATTDFRILISLSGHRLQVFKGTERILDTPAGIGTDETPTPVGSYYLLALIRPTNKSKAYGPYAYALSGHSPKLTSFAGGDGRLGIHGTNDPSSVGKTVSHGCIRLTNDVITDLAEKVGLPLGTPVVVVA